MSDNELQKELASSKEALFKLNFQKVVDEFTNTSLLSKAKRKIAKIETLLRLREIEKQKEKEKEKQTK